MEIISDRNKLLYPENGKILICPICNESFEVTDKTRFIRGKNYVCSWKCFRTPIGSTAVQEEEPKGETPPIVEETPKVEKKTRKKKEVHKEAPILENGIVDLFG